MSNPWARDVVEQLLDAGLAVPLYELSRAVPLGDALDTARARRLAVMLRDQGFLVRARVIADECGRPRSGDNPLREAIDAELRFLRGEIADDLIRPQVLTSRPGRVLHVVGASLPDVNSTFTRRTHAIAASARSMGVDVVIVSQPGTTDAKVYDVDHVDGIDYHRIPGPTRGAVPPGEWLALFATRLAAVVRKVHPCALVAASDFVNGVAVRAVGRAYGLPVIQDLRGAWEDSWLARERDRHGWSEDQVPGRWGHPDVWTLRRERESVLVRDADAVLAISEDVAQAAVAAGARPGTTVVVSDVGAEGARYVGLLEAIGVLEQGTQQIAALRGGDVEPAALRTALAAAPRRPLERTTTTGVRGAASDIRARGWVLGSLPPVLLDLPFDWVSACRDNRSQAFHLHAWDFMVPFLRAWAHDGDEDALRWCLERAVSWCAVFTEGDDRGTMAWYDMALGLRAPRLAYLLSEALALDVDESVVATLGAAVVRHQVEIFAPRAFNPRTNHGFYTAVGQLSFARRLRPLRAMDHVLRQGRERLSEIVSRQFAADGGHLEHSPDYHRMLLESFLDAVDDDLVDDPDVVERLRRAETVMGWLIQPDRTIVQLGDSPATPVNPDARVVRSPESAFIASGGTRGVPCANELLVLPDTGYAIVRSPQPVGTDDHLTAGYVTFMAAFHSRAHKHCDDLSLTWFDRGTAILIDPGRFGYLDQLPAAAPERELGFYYGRPERQYVERTMAHNTVQVDEDDHQRRGREPYGSGLVSAEHREGHFRIVGSVDHGTWTHSRTVTYRPGAWMHVEDDVRATDGERHDFRVWWNLSGDLQDPEVGRATVRFALPGHVSELCIANLDGAEMIPPVRGATEPLRGWRSVQDYELTPAWSTGFVVRQRERHVLRTLLSLDGVLDQVPEHPFSPGAASSVGATTA